MIPDTVRAKIKAENAQMARVEFATGTSYRLIFQHEGFKCLVARDNSTNGHNIGLCGYVRIPADHILRGHDVFTHEVDPKVTDEDTRRLMRMKIELTASLDVHGGVTFSRERLRDGDWYIGFDCAHVGDIWCDEDDLRIFDGDSYRDLEYVIVETQKLATQLKAMYV